ncbi:MAG: chemotaxis protein CheW [Polyangiaceae bacterium]
MKHETQHGALLAQLREEFDREFGRPARALTTEHVEFLGFRAGGGTYAVDLGDVSIVHEIRHVTRVPSAHRGFEGLVTVLDDLVAVYDLAALLVGAKSDSARRWLLVSRKDGQVGFAVQAVDGYLRTPRSKIVSQKGRSGRGDFLGDAIDEEEGLRRIVDFGALIADIRATVGGEGRSAR